MCFIFTKVSPRRENIRPAVDANVENTHTWGWVDSRELENPRAMLSFRCDVEKGAVARESTELWPGVRHHIDKISLETHSNVWMRYEAVAM